MAKVKKAFFCQSCGAQNAQWQGQCNACKAWNTLVEEIIEKETPKEWVSDTSLQNTIPIPINAIDVTQTPRIKTKDEELNRVLGGGVSSLVSYSFGWRAWYWKINVTTSSLA
jgi:DNA repair protein RadA/Sms